MPGAFVERCFAVCARPRVHSQRRRATLPRSTLRLGVSSPRRPVVAMAAGLRSSGSAPTRAPPSSPVIAARPSVSSPMRPGTVLARRAAASLRRPTEGRFTHLCRHRAGSVTACAHPMVLPCCLRPAYDARGGACRESLPRSAFRPRCRETVCRAGVSDDSNRPCIRDPTCSTLLGRPRLKGVVQRYVLHFTNLSMGTEFLAISDSAGDSQGHVLFLCRRVFAWPVASHLEGHPCNACSGRFTEHIVAASEAHDSGLCRADRTTRARFSQDLLNLTLAAPEINRCDAGGKCAFDAAQWLPDRNRCWFAARVVAVRKKYGLTIDPRESVALDHVLSGCASTKMVLYRQPTTTASPAASVPTTRATTATTDALGRWDDNRNGRITCAEARRHGIAPVKFMRLIGGWGAWV